MGLQGGACGTNLVADAVDRDAVGVRWDREESERRDGGEGNRQGENQGARGRLI